MRERWEPGAVLRAARVLLDVDRRLTASVALLLILGAALPAIFKVATGVFVGSVPGVIGEGFGSPSGRTLLAAFGAVGLLHLMEQVWPLIQNFAQRSLSFRFAAHVRSGVMQDLMAPDGIGHLETPTLKDSITRVQGLGAQQVLGPGQFVSNLFQVVSARLSGIGSAVLLVAFEWWVPLLLILVWWFLHRGNEKEQAALYEALRGATADTRRSYYYRGLVSEPHAAKEVRIFGLLDWITERYRKHWWAGIEPSWRERRGLSARHLSGAVLLLGSQALVFGVLALEALRGEVSLTEVTIFVQAILGMQAFGPIGILGWRLRASAEPIAEWLDLRRQMEEVVPPVISGLRSAEGLPDVTIQIEGLSFAYPGTERRVFDGLDLEIHAGRSLAIVGANGAGKTTLVKLLARLYDPQEGSILVDGIDIREFDIESWRRRVAVIFQDFVQYPLSARDNVAFGALHLRDDEAALETAARRAGAKGIVETLPKGWETILSREFTDGADLSGGQWQRMALARALFAVEAGAGVLTLDEPTANLDVRAEAEFFQRFLELTKGITTILISHRFSTVRRAARICVLEEGRVIEDGSHGELMELGGRYARFFRLQAARFEERSDA